jgi:hypothetical protein
MASKTYYTADYLPNTVDLIRSKVDLSFPLHSQTVVEFINGQFTTSDPEIQAVLDARPGFMTLAQWQAAYKTIPRIGGHAQYK